MKAADRELIELISNLTDDCLVLDLRIHVVDAYGKERAARVVRDGFAGVVRPDDGDVEELSRLGRGERLLPTEESLRVIGLTRISRRCSVAQMPGAIAFEDEPRLVSRYAADEPEAIAAVRSRHGQE